MFRLTLESAARIIAEESALATLRDYPIEEVWGHLDEPDACEDEGEAFQLLMNAMYALRPVGHL